MNDWQQRVEAGAKRRAAFARSLTIREKAGLVQKWIEENRSEAAGSERGPAEKNVSDCMYDPDVGWELIVAIVEQTDNPVCLTRLGAWHLEEWLAVHGHAAIVRVERLAAQSQKFRNVLACVYQNSIPADVYQRVRVAVADGKLP